LLAAPLALVGVRALKPAVKPVPCVVIGGSGSGYTLCPVVSIVGGGGTSATTEMIRYANENGYVVHGIGLANCSCA
jgi:hypothetical protein